MVPKDFEQGVHKGGMILDVPDGTRTSTSTYSGANSPSGSISD